MYIRVEGTVYVFKCFCTCNPGGCAGSRTASAVWSLRADPLLSDTERHGGGHGHVPGAAHVG